MKILLTNDDGYRSTFLNALYAYCVANMTEHRFVVMAPKHNKSGMSQAISMNGEIRYEQVKDSWYAVDGTPTDCVMVGTYVFPDIDMVISGPNEGSNLGQDILYSGTAAAAREAVLKNLPAIALSITDESNNDLEQFSKERFFAFLDLWLVPFIHLAMEKKPYFINVNISNLESLEVEEAVLSHRYYYGFSQHNSENGIQSVKQTRSGVDDTRAPSGSDWKVSLGGKAVYTVLSAWPQEEHNTFSQLQAHKSKKI